MNGRIVFDLDGTLIDSAPDIRKIANEVLAETGVEPITLSETRDFIGEGIHRFVEKMRGARDLPASCQIPMLDNLVSRYDDAVTLTVPYPGVVAALQSLSENHRLGICTNKLYSPCIAILKHLQLEKYFVSVWGGDNPLGRKPAPDPLLAAFEELGEGPRVYVGDSETDSATAEAAGVPFLLFTQGYRKKPIVEIPHLIAFSDFEELPDLVATQFGT